MHQRWEDLLFLHWAWEAAEIQATLPPGLWVDTWEGRAWLGVVPFKMAGVRPRGLPAVPGISDFLELNLRTYVYDAQGRPGVWFYSLECASRLAVTLARSLFGLPYVHARMERRGDLATGGVETYTSQRPGGGVNRFRYAAAGASAQAEPRSFAWWLVERYRLFSVRADGRLRIGSVSHPPYRVAPARVDVGEAGVLLADNGFAPPTRPADHALVAAGVVVRAHALRGLS